MLKRGISFIAFLLLSSAAIAAPLKVHPTNPRYFADDSGNAVFMVGSHTWCNLQDQCFEQTTSQIFDWDAYIDMLKANHHNYIRIWIMHGTIRARTYADKFLTDPMPWVRSNVPGANDGGNKFDLNKANQGVWNEAFFTRLRDRVQQAGNEGIYVGVMFFEGWHVHFFRGKNLFYGHVFNENNNINGIDGNGDDVYTLVNPQVTALQEKFVAKVIDTLHDQDNVLWEIANQACAESGPWQNHMVDFIKSYEAQKEYPKHPVGMTPFGGSDYNAFLFASDADWISPRWAPDGEYSADPTSSDGSKVIILDTDHIEPVREGFSPMIPWIWKSFVRGHNISLMDDFPNPTFRGVDMVSARRALGDARGYAIKAGITDMVPRSDLSSTKYCLAKAGEKYIIYSPGSGSFTVSGLVSGSSYTYEWLNTATGGVTSSGTFTASSSSRSFSPQYIGTVLYLKKIGGCGNSVNRRELRKLR